MAKSYPNSPKNILLEKSLLIHLDNGSNKIRRKIFLGTPEWYPHKESGITNLFNGWS